MGVWERFCVCIRQGKCVLCGAHDCSDCSPNNNSPPRTRMCMRWQYSAGNTTLEWKYRIDCTVSCCLEYNNSSRFTFTVCPRNCPATAPQPRRINPGSMTAMNTFAKQRGPKNNKNHSPACLHVCWQRLKNAKKHQKTTWAAKTNLKKPEEDMFCSDAKTP